MKLKSSFLTRVLAALLILGIWWGAYWWFQGKTGNKEINRILDDAEMIHLKWDTEQIQKRELLRLYYEKFGYKKTWTGLSEIENTYRRILLRMLGYADSLSLDRHDYHDEFIRSYDSLSKRNNISDADFETESELIFTDAAITFLYHVAYGKDIKLSFEGVKHRMDSSQILNAFHLLIQTHDWRTAIESLEPKNPAYHLIKQKMNHMAAAIRDSSLLLDSPVNSWENDKTAIIHILYAYGCLDNVRPADSLSSDALKNTVKLFQQIVNADTTGIIDKKTLEALNYPVTNRLKEMKETLNAYRWVQRLSTDEYLFINIPAARMHMMKRDSVLSTMRVILGKSSTPTPVFTAYIHRVITYPYWVVPVSIATKEILPMVKKDITYLERNNFQVLNAKGEILDPASVEWQKYSVNYLPFTFRQSTGCDNSLGVLKFDLNVPFSIYLHDTNAKKLFGNKMRYISHGCIRVERPMELAQYLLKDSLNSNVMDTLQSCLKDQTPKDIPLSKRHPVIILYMTADVDEHGKMRFYQDIYNRN